MPSIRQIIRSESFGGILLFAAALFALILDNTMLTRGPYESLIHTPLTIKIGELILDKPLILWINDGLMAIFFLLVGLEIKREIYKGMLQDIKTVILPTVGAIGGIVVPGLIYVVLNYQDPRALAGWGIPVATDIAFSLGILALLGTRVPTSLKIFLTALAIIDDIAAIIIIALFYTKHLSYGSLFIAAAMILVLFVMNRLKIMNRAPYFIVGVILWASVLKSGIHATLAGIILAFAIPIGEGDSESPLVKTEHTLVPWVTYMVLPLFAFANTGFPFDGLTMASLLHPVPLGIGLGLFVGKQLGIFSSCWLCVKTKFAKLPEGMDWKSLYGVALLCGVGFTMSLFIGALAFADAKAEFARYVRMGVLAGSLLSGLGGYLFLYYCFKGNGKRALNPAKAN